MAKTPISQGENEMLKAAFKAPKEGEHVNWRAFSDSVNEVFTTKGLEKDLDVEVGAVRTQTIYGRRSADDAEREICRQVVE